MYCFLTKKGELRKSYYEVFEYLNTATIQHHEIMVGRYDTVVDEYDCYSTKLKKFREPKRASTLNKIQKICNDFNCTCHIWYSGIDMRTDLHGDNVEKMLKEIRKYM